MSYDNKQKNKIIDKPQEKEVVKTLNAVVHEVEETSVIVNIQGWRMRVYGKNLDAKVGREVAIDYTGDLEDIHTIKLIKLV